MDSKNRAPLQEATPDKKSCVIHKEMLPLYCPTEEMGLWNAHPRIYLDITKTGAVCCPYCGTKFVLKT